jgi:hypothetical protein
VLPNYQQRTAPFSEGLSLSSVILCLLPDSVGFSTDSPIYIR